MSTNRIVSAELATGSRRSQGRFLGEGVLGASWDASGEFDSLGRFVVGADSRCIQWSTLASGRPLAVRRTRPEKAVQTLLAVDTSSSVWQVEAVRRQTLDVLEQLLELPEIRSGRVLLAEFSEALGRCTVVLSGGRVLQAIREAFAEKTGRPQTRTCLAEVCRQLDAALRIPSRVVLITDMLDCSDWQDALARLAHRHDVFVALLEHHPVDELPAEQEWIRLQDSETGECRLVQATASLRQEATRCYHDFMSTITQAIEQSGATRLSLL